ncbi:MAG: hypothetical protein Q9217_004146 [Psora testacea]
MTLTRLQLGETPKKTDHPGFVETPTRRGRKAATGDSIDTSPNTSQTVQAPKSASKKATANGTATSSKSRGRPAKGGKEDYKVDATEHFEFGGSAGVTIMMVVFPLLMWYMWIGATYYDGKIPWPKRNESWLHFFLMLGNLVYDGAFPTLKAWIIYWIFFIFEAACYLCLPGIYVKGKPLEWEGGKRLDYYCSGVWSFFTTIVVAAVLHLTGLFKLYTIIDEFGPLMSVAILSGFLVSIVAYISALYRGTEHRMSGHHIYDFFMGAELNPRLFGLLDFKMFSEVRVPWYILFLVTCGAAARQYEQYGYVSGEVGDMYYEKWGFMLIFWNLAGVPLSYCHSTIFLANRPPNVYHWNPIALALLYISYIFVYWVWDTCNSQKNRFRQQERGTLTMRRTFPQLPWQTVKDPKTIQTKTGDSILVDGWYGYARKIHYTCDLYFALTWGLITGFASPFPWFYAAFFTPMILHRAVRDTQKCRKQYGTAWEEYEKQVPYLFIPVGLLVKVNFYD